MQKQTDYIHFNVQGFFFSLFSLEYFPLLICYIQFLML